MDKEKIMKVHFKATLPKKDSCKIIIDLPADVCKTLNKKPVEKVDVIINGKKYLGDLYKKNESVFSLQIRSVKAIQRDIGLGETVSFTIEPRSISKRNNELHNDIIKKNDELHKIVLDWEATEAKILMKKIGIKPDYKIIDFGCGYGHYTIPCALALNNTGKVFAIDRHNISFGWIKTKSDMFNLQNIELIKTNGSNVIDFPDKSINIILFYDVLHGGNNRLQALLKEGHRVLKKGGILSTLNFDSDIRKLSMTQQDLSNEILKYGFKFSHSINNGVHFDHYHSNYHMKKGVTFSELERDKIYNFIKI